MTTHADLIASEAAYIVTRQRATGAILTLSDTSIDPYFGHTAAHGLVLAGSDYWSAARAWGDWYVDHMNTPENSGPDVDGMHGTVFVHAVDGNGLEYELNVADADDSAASLFITFARYLWDSGDTDNRAWVTDNAYYIRLAASVLTRLLDSDNLTIARPSFNIRYTMDNCETWRGFVDMAHLEAEAFGGRAAAYEAKAALVLAAIESFLWSSTVYLVNKGASAPTLSTLYPDARAQLHPILMNVIAPTSARAASIWSTFKGNFPSWLEVGHGDVFPLCQIGYVARLMGDFAGLDNFVSAVHDQFILAKRSSGTITFATSSGTVGATIGGTLVTVTWATSDTVSAALLAVAINANATTRALVNAESLAGVVHLKAVVRGAVSISLVASGTNVTVSGATLTLGRAAHAYPYYPGEAGWLIRALDGR